MAGDPGRTIVITVGRLTQQKNYPDLIQAFGLLKDRHPEARLVIVGSGRRLGELQSQAQQAGLAERVNFLGPRVDVPDLLEASDLYVNSSLWEGLPCTILEGMAAGLPVVATDVGDSARAVIREAGRIVPPARPELLSEALANLLSQAEMRREMGAAAKAHVSRMYALEPWAERLLKLYGSVLGEAVPAASGNGDHPAPERRDGLDAR
jgi:glycosyltransferase involved in cell wall biosynthesis